MNYDSFKELDEKDQRVCFSYFKNATNYLSAIHQLSMPPVPNAPLFMPVVPNSTVMSMPVAPNAPAASMPVAPNAPAASMPVAPNAPSVQLSMPPVPN